MPISPDDMDNIVIPFINFDVGKALTNLNPDYVGLSRSILTECVEVVNGNHGDKAKYSSVYHLAQAVNYYIVNYESQLKDNIKNHKSLTGLRDTLQVIYKEYFSNNASPASIVDRLLKHNKLPTQTGGQKIRKYRKTRTNPSKSNIRNKRRRTRRRRRYT